MTNFTLYQREDFLADESFTNYLLQKNTADVRFWSNWINNNPEHDNEVKEAVLLFFLIKEQKELPGYINRTEVDDQYARLQSQLGERNLVTDDASIYISSDLKRKKRSFLKKIILIPAAAAAIFFLVFFTWNYLSLPGNAPFKTVAKTGNFNKVLTLPDGSFVQLNSNSSLAITTKYNHEKREVVLNGSAFFKVYKDHKKPFIVTAGIIKTTALGTSFYVYNPGGKSISVSLLEGSVRVQGNRNSVELLPGEKAVYTIGRSIFIESFNKTQLLNFTKGKIQFEHANLQEIKTVLQEYFNRDVVVQGNFPKVNFTGSFDAKKIETILEALQFTYNITYRSEGQKLIISF